MTATKSRPEFVFLASLALAFLNWTTPVQAEIRLDGNWPREIRPDGTWVPDKEKETWLMEDGAEKWARELSAIQGVDGNDRLRYFDSDLGFRLFVNDNKYYIKPAMFVARSKPGEICTPTPFKNAPTYRCDEGQTLATSCHVFFFNERVQRAGHHVVAINEKYTYFCNAMPALGVGDKANNLVLVTVQYFNTERKPASKVAEVGSSWNRMTVAFRIKAVDGRIKVEQDDSCLGNPNRIEAIPEARKRLKACGSGTANQARTTEGNRP